MKKIQDKTLVLAKEAAKKWVCSCTPGSVDPVQRSVWQLFFYQKLIFGHVNIFSFVFFSCPFQVMTNASLPSTLVKCLYLFFDLPVLTNSVSEESFDGSSVGGAASSDSSNRLYSSKERRLLLQKMFIQVLLKLCTFQPAVEELARKDDLTLLFSAVTSECPSHNGK